MSKSQELSTTLAKRPVFRNKQSVEKWLQKYDITNYTIQDDLTVDVAGDVDLSSKKLDFLSVNFGVISGDFYCSRNKLLTFEGCPLEVKGNFICSANRLTSFEYAPKIVGGQFDGRYNSFTHFQDFASQVFGTLDCSHNQITSLQGLPEALYGLICDTNKLTSLQGAPQHIELEFSCCANELTSLVGGPQYVGFSFNCSRNELKSLEGGPTNFVPEYRAGANCLTSMEYLPSQVGLLVVSYNKITSFQSSLQSVEDIYIDSNPVDSLESLEFEVKTKLHAYLTPIREFRDMAQAFYDTQKHTDNLGGMIDWDGEVSAQELQKLVRERDIAREKSFLHQKIVERKEPLDKTVLKI